jgi:myo-inositol-1(or 4)-monophosphatase
MKVAILRWYPIAARWLKVVTSLHPSQRLFLRTAMDDFLPVCEEAARLGGSILLQFAGKAKVREKAKHDLVTEADLASQAAIHELLSRRFPTHGFLGEEDANAISRSMEAAPDEYRWVVDPLDGTANYVHSLGNYAVSIALQHCGEMICGVVFDPIANDCFTAVRGQGAKLNGQRLTTSGCTSLDQAMVAASFSPNVPRGSIEIARFIEVLHASQSIRRLGSAALNLCYVGAGRLDGYWASSVKIWDIAAGMLVLTEAGGVISALDGKPIDLAHPEFAASSTPQLQAQLLATLEVKAL